MNTSTQISSRLSNQNTDIFSDVSNKISLDKDFTRFLDDPTFPYKVTVCIGEKRIVCSGVLLAQQSSVLEKKFRNDDGVLMFEEMIGVCNSNVVLHECVRFMHGASISFTPRNIEVILKFGSWYKVKQLTEAALNWIFNKHLCKDVMVIDLLHYFRLCNRLHLEESTKLKQNIFSFLEDDCDNISFKSLPASYFGYLLELNGFDLARIAATKPFSKSSVFPDWVALSIENKNFVLENTHLFDFKKLFDSTETFCAFMDLFSEEESLMCNGPAIKSLLQIQRGFLSGKSKETSEESETAAIVNAHNLQETVVITNAHSLQETAVTTNARNLVETAVTTNARTLEDIAVTTNARDLEDIAVSDRKHGSCTDLDSEPVHITKKSLNKAATSCSYGNSKTKSYTRSSYRRSDESDNVNQYSKSSVWIGNIPKCVTNIELEMMFERFGMIDQVVLKRSRHPTFDYAFIHFDYVTSARSLLRQSRYESFEIYGVKLRVAEPLD